MPYKVDEERDQQLKKWGIELIITSQIDKAWKYYKWQLVSKYFKGNLKTEEEKKKFFLSACTSCYRREFEDFFGNDLELVNKYPSNELKFSLEFSDDMARLTKEELKILLERIDISFKEKEDEIEITLKNLDEMRKFDLAYKKEGHDKIFLSKTKAQLQKDYDQFSHGESYFFGKGIYRLAKDTGRSINKKGLVRKEQMERLANAFSLLQANRGISPEKKAKILYSLLTQIEEEIAKEKNFLSSGMEKICKKYKKEILNGFTNVPRPFVNTPEERKALLDELTTLQRYSFRPNP